MPLNKIQYTDNVTVIPADNLNEIQDAIIDNEDAISSLESQTYTELSNKPQINGITLEGNKTSTQLGIPTANEVGSIEDEVTDIRVGADGVTYDSAGTAVRNQLVNVSTAMVNSIANMLDAKPLIFKNGYYSTPAIGSTSVYTTSAGSLKCAISPCSENDVVFVRAHGTSGSSRAFAFLDSEYKVLTRTDSNFNSLSVYRAPANSAYVVVNSYTDVDYYAYVGQPISKINEITINNILRSKTKNENVAIMQFEYGRITTPEVGTQVSLSHLRIYSAGYISAITPCSEGDEVHINTSEGYSASYRCWAFLDADGYCLHRANSATIGGEQTLIAPVDTAYVIVNTAIDYDYYGYIGSNITDQIENITDQIENITDQIENITDQIEELRYEQYGNVGMFDSIAVVGTSWDAAYFYSNRSGAYHAYTRRHKGWIMNLANMYGIDGYNFGVTSGTTCLPDSPYVGVSNAVSWQGDSKGLLALQASNVGNTLYFMDLQKNDAKKFGTAYLGTIEDIDDSDYTNNPDTFFGNYGRIIELIKAKDPHPYFVFTYTKSSQVTTIENVYADAVIEIAEHYGCPAINWFDDEYYSEWIYSHLIEHHPTMVEYAAIAKVMDRLFGKVIVENYDYFKDYLPASV